MATQAVEWGLDDASSSDDDTKTSTKTTLLLIGELRFEGFAPGTPNGSGDAETLKGRAWVLREGVNRVGRDPGGEVELGQATVGVSGEHVIIEAGDISWLKDCNSTNKTRLRIQRPGKKDKWEIMKAWDKYMLPDGAVFALGSTLLKFIQYDEPRPPLQDDLIIHDDAGATIALDAIGGEEGDGNNTEGENEGDGGDVIQEPTSEADLMAPTQAVGEDTMKDVSVTGEEIENGDGDDGGDPAAATLAYDEHNVVLGATQAVGLAPEPEETDVANAAAAAAAAETQDGPGWDPTQAAGGSDPNATQDGPGWDPTQAVGGAGADDAGATQAVGLGMNEEETQDGPGWDPTQAVGAAGADDAGATQAVGGFDADATQAVGTGLGEEEETQDGPGWDPTQAVGGAGVDDAGATQAVGAFDADATQAVGAGPEEEETQDGPGWDPTQPVGLADATQPVGAGAGAGGSEPTQPVGAGADVDATQPVGNQSTPTRPAFKVPKPTLKATPVADGTLMVGTYAETQVVGAGVNLPAVAGGGEIAATIPTGGDGGDATRPGPGRLVRFDSKPQFAPTPVLSASSSLESTGEAPPMIAKPLGRRSPLRGGPARRIPLAAEPSLNDLFDDEDAPPPKAPTPPPVEVPVGEDDGEETDAGETDGEDGDNDKTGDESEAGTGKDDTDADADAGARAAKAAAANSAPRHRRPVRRKAARDSDDDDDDENDDDDDTNTRKGLRKRRNAIAETQDDGDHDEEEKADAASAEKDQAAVEDEAATAEKEQAAAVEHEDAAAKNEEGADDQEAVAAEKEQGADDREQASAEAEQASGEQEVEAADREASAGEREEAAAQHEAAADDQEAAAAENEAAAAATEDQVDAEEPAPASTRPTRATRGKGRSAAKEVAEPEPEPESKTRSRAATRRGKRARGASQDQTDPGNDEDEEGGAKVEEPAPRATRRRTKAPVAEAEPKKATTASRTTGRKRKATSQDPEVEEENKAPAGRSRKAARTNNKEPTPEPQDEAEDEVEPMEDAEPVEDETKGVTVAWTGILDDGKNPVLENLGAVISEDVGGGKVTHLVTDKPRRTMKFMLAMGTVPHIVTPQWVNTSIRQKSLVPPGPFVLKEVKTARDRRGAPALGTLFHGLVFLLAPGIRPGPDDMARILETHGGQVVRKVDLVPEEKTLWVIASTKAELKKGEFKKAVDSGHSAVKAEWVIGSILANKLEKPVKHHV